MTRWTCARCAVEYPDSHQPPDRCAICSDERECVEPPGQRWTTLAELERDGHHESLHEVLDDDLIAAVAGAGGVAAIAASHPHMFGVQVEWSHRFGGAPVYVNRADQDWLQRDDPVVRRWDAELEALPGLTLNRIGGHFPGSAVLHAVGADGRGTMLCGDTFLVTPGQDWVTFMRRFPNLIPLSAAVVDGVAERVLSLDFDRLYDNFGGRVGTGAAGRVRRSAERYIGWVRGDHDNLTTVR